jgi:hypothetical protein
VLVKGQHLPNHLATIIHGHSHPIIDETGHLPLLVRHDI